MDDMQEDTRTVDGREKGHSPLCEGVLVTCNMEDAEMCRWGEIF